MRSASFRPFLGLQRILLLLLLLLFVSFVLCFSLSFFFPLLTCCCYRRFHGSADQERVRAAFASCVVPLLLRHLRRTQPPLRTHQGRLPLRSLLISSLIFMVTSSSSCVPVFDSCAYTYITYTRPTTTNHTMTLMPSSSSSSSS